MERRNIYCKIVFTKRMKHDRLRVAEQLYSYTDILPNPAKERKLIYG